MLRLARARGTVPAKENEKAANALLSQRGREASEMAEHARRVRLVGPATQDGFPLLACLAVARDL